MRALTVIAPLLLLVACQAPTPPATPPAADAGVAAPAPVAAPPPATAAPPPATVSFVDKVWRVAPGGSIEPGSTYVFLADGTLVIDSPNGTPMVGRWARQGEGLTMTEDGITYPVDILQLDAEAFRIRSRNPGSAIEIAFAPAPDQPLPSSPTR